MKRQSDTGEGVNDAQRGVRAVLDAQVSEAQWQEQVIHAANLAGFRCHHQLIPFRRGKDGTPRAIVEPGTHRGFPDLILCHAERQEILFVELKRQDGRLTKEQELWRDALQAAGARWYMWKPSDWALVRRVLGLPAE